MKPRAAGGRPKQMDLALRLAQLGEKLRAEGVGTSLKDELDAAEAMMLADRDDTEEMRSVLRIALKIPRSHYDVFERLFAEFMHAENGGAGTKAPPAPRACEPKAKPSRQRQPRLLRWDPDTRQLVDGDAEPELEGEHPGYSPEALLRRKSFDEVAVGQRDLILMERLLARLGRRLATVRSRRLVPTRGRGLPDVRGSYRRSLRTFGEIVNLARRVRPIERPRLVFLCDTSGSMDAHARFLLMFVLSLGRMRPRAQVFAFNTELIPLTPSLFRGAPRQMLDEIVQAVPDWSGGTRLGDCLAAFEEQYLARCVDGKTIVVVLSDGLDQGDPATLTRAVAAIRRRAKKLIWCNPLLGDPRYEPKARGMTAALPFIDLFCTAHDIQSLERLLPHLKG